MSTKTSISDLQDAIQKKLLEYEDVIFEATEEGLTAAQKVLINAQKAASPKGVGEHIGGEYRKSWKGTNKKYKLKRFVGNSKMVKGKKGKEDIPLSNVLEYSTKSPYRGLIKRTFNENIDTMADAIVKTIKEA